MSLKLKALGLSLLVAVAVSAVTAANASANEEGHFVTDLTHAALHGFSGFGHNLHFVQHNVAGQIGCDEPTYVATMLSPSKTVSELTVTPTYKKCYTTGSGEPGSVTIDVNGCTYRFKVAKNTTSTTEQTGRLECPAGAALKITHPNCTISIHPQNINTGLTYTKVVGPPHHITIDSDAQFTITVHGLCQFITPTVAAGTLIGSVRVKAFDPNDPKKELNLTAT
jgi:hypothetical protein